MKHKVKSVEEGSIAWQLGVRPGDTLVSINGEEVVDFIDYQALSSEENIVLTVESGGEITDYSFQKDAYEPLGMEFFGDMLGKVILFLEDIDQKISTSDLAGTWIYKDESGTELARYNFSGNSYSRLVKSDHSNHVTIWEDSGTWSYSKGKITFSGCEYPELASLRAYLDGDTLYVANLLEWDFYSAAYECIKTKNQ